MQETNDRRPVVHAGRPPETRERDLVGRDAELAAVSAWVAQAASGPASLVVRGEPGIGKSRILGRALELAGGAGLRVLRARPVEAELALGFAGLGDLLLPVVDEAAPSLPAAQRHALGAALGTALDEIPPDTLLVGRATLGVLERLAEATPVVVAIDDAQWLDPASARAVAFAVRRLGETRVSVAVAVREPFDDPVGLLAAVPDPRSDLRLGGLDLEATGRLLLARSDSTPPSGRRIADIHRRSAGNPMYAIELARAGDPEALPSSLDELVGRRIATLGPGGRDAVERVAVLGPVPFASLPQPVSLDEAVAAAVLVEQEGEVRFVHPLLAAAAYGQIPPARRRALHREAAALETSLESRARHLALAASGPDADVAVLLDDAARAARARGAPESAAGLARHARRLTPPSDEAGRLRRAMDEADALFVAGDEPAARAIVDAVLADEARGSTRVRALLQRALTALDPVDAVASLEAAVAEPHDDELLATRTLAQLAWQRGAWLGDVEPAVDEALEAVARAEALGDPATLVTARTAAGMILSLAGRPNAADQFRLAIEGLERAPHAAGDHTARLAFANERWWRGEFEAGEELLAEDRRIAEEHGDEGTLLRLTVFGAELAMRRGRWDEAAALLDRALLDARDYWRLQVLLRRAMLRARRGDARALDDAAELRASPAAGTDPITVAAADFATGVLDAAAGRVADAARRMRGLAALDARSGSRAAEFAVTIPEIVTVLVEAGQLDDARALADGLAARSVQLAPWSEAAAALCHGLVAHAAGRPDEALALLARAADGFSALGAPWELGQAHLALGSVLRRAGRRRDAADQLDRAIAIFEELGAAPAAARARDELRRAQPRRRHDDSLTDAERGVARLVARGLTNREVAGRLFTTVATVEAHLTRIYAKVGVRSRTELAGRVADGTLDVGAGDDPGEDPDPGPVDRR